MSTDIHRARNIIYQAWLDRQDVVLDCTGWHVCNCNCEMQKLEAWACLEGNHAIACPRCPVHTKSKPVLVNDLYVCSKTSKKHVCDGGEQCVVEQGVCLVTGAPIMQHVCNEQGSSRRHKKQRMAVYTDEQVACAFIYDLLFSERRMQYERDRLNMCNETSRRTAQRHVRECCRTGTPLFLQDITDIFLINRDRLRSMAYMKKYKTRVQQINACKLFAKRVQRLWMLLSAHINSPHSFQTAVAAVLYLMRRGVACDGVMVIPSYPLMADALPDAHAIKEVGVHRRQFTNIKNQISTTIRKLVDNHVITAVDIADCYDSS